MVALRIPLISVLLLVLGSLGHAQVRWQESGGGADYVGFSAPSSVTTSTVWTLPAADGSANQCLVTDGAGKLSWASSSGGFAGKVKYAGAGSCIWSATSGSWVNHSAQSSCPTPTVSGSASAPGTKIPGITFTSLPAGTSEVSGSAPFYIDAAAASCRWTIYDGTSREGIGGGNISGETTTSLEGIFTYASTQSNITFQVQAIRTAGSGTCMIANDEPGILNFTIWVKKL